MSFNRQVETEEGNQKTSTESESKSGPSVNKFGLSDKGSLLSQEECSEDKKKTTAVPPSGREGETSSTVAGITHYTKVRSRRNVYTL